MTVSFHKYGEYFPGTGEVRVSDILKDVWSEALTRLHRILVLGEAEATL